LALFGIVQVQGAAEHPSWYNPQYAIPLRGMILGNTGAVSLSLDRVSHELASKRDQVETLLAAGGIDALGGGPLGRRAGRPRRMVPTIIR